MNAIRKNKIIIAVVVVISLLIGLPSYAKAEETINYFLTVHEKVLVSGETFNLQIPNGVNYNYTVEGNPYCVSVTQDDYTNSLWITGLSNGEATIVVNLYDQNQNYIASDSCRVIVTNKGLEEESLVCAVGKTEQLHISGYSQIQTISWTSSNPAVATVDQSGSVTGVSMGYANIFANCVEVDGRVTTYTCQVAVSNPKLQKTSGNLAVNCTQELELTGLQPGSKVTLTTSNASVATVYEYSYTIYAIKKGTAIITCEVDGVKLTYKVTVTDPKANVQLLPIVKGKKAKLTITGTNKNSTISYNSLSARVANVDKKGYVTGKNAGCTSIQIIVDGKELLVPVSVGSSKVIGTLKYAINAIGTTYSQAKRMENGFYDCSSLTWRAYHSVGVDIGNKYWAPTAADMAKTLVKNKKAIAYKALPADKLQPGDLLFFTKTDGTDNGRYKNIYHVAIFYGTYGNELENGLLLEARLDGVGVFRYSPSDRKVAVVARPTK
jgi:cell wall-associated NlpC family hydrolase